MIKDLSNEELSEKSQKRTGNPVNDRANKQELLQKVPGNAAEKPDGAPETDHLGTPDETKNA